MMPVYDQFARLLMPERKLKQTLISHAGLGAGTGTLAVMVKQVQPQVGVRGLEGDADIGLARV
jgi:16S rRNA G1207 methylase RsmC